MSQIDHCDDTKVDYERGLTSKQAEENLKKYGENRLVRLIFPYFLQFVP